MYKYIKLYGFRYLKNCPSATSEMQDISGINVTFSNLLRSKNQDIPTFQTTFHPSCTVDQRVCTTLLEVEKMAKAKLIH